MIKNNLCIFYEGIRMKRSKTMFQWIRKIICKYRGHHHWVRRCYGGLGGSYFVTECSCCGIKKEDSFEPEMTL